MKMLREVVVVGVVVEVVKSMWMVYEGRSVYKSLRESREVYKPP